MGNKAENTFLFYSFDRVPISNSTNTFDDILKINQSKKIYE